MPQGLFLLCKLIIFVLSVEVIAFLLLISMEKILKKYQYRERSL